MSGKQLVSFCSETQLRQRIATGQDEGVPRYAAIRMTYGENALYQIGFYPIPKIQSNASMWYVSQAPEIAPLGGPAHSETIVAACIAAADMQMNPERMMEREGGSLFYQLYQQRLAASVMADRKLLGIEDGLTE